MAIYLGTVTNVYDEMDGGRIKVFIPSVDNSIPNQNDYPWVFPLLPKFFHVVPKIGETVLIICQDDGNPRSQRFYIGPIISQPQLMYDAQFTKGATSMLNNGLNITRTPISNIPKAKGTQPNDDDIAILGRKNCDIMMGDDSIEIRSGAKVVNELDKEDIEFNKQSPAYIKLKIHDNNTSEIKGGIEGPDNVDGNCQSSAIISADYINLLSPNGDPYLKTPENREMISDDEITRMLKEAHSLPYGDVLVDVLVKLIAMFKSHVHPYPLMKPVPDSNANIFAASYGANGENIKDKMLSNHVRVN